MASFLIWRNLSGSSPNFMLEDWNYNTATSVITYTPPYNIGMTPLGSYHPPAGTLFYDECDSDDVVYWKGSGGFSSVTIETVYNYPGCCDVYYTNFHPVKTNNTSPTTPNGTITITATGVSINDYEASIDGGTTYVPGSGGTIEFTGLAAAEYTILIRSIAGVCGATTSITVFDNIVYPPPLVEETTLPVLYAPIFHPITIGYRMINNDATVKEDGNGTYLEVLTDDGKDYLATLPIIKIFDNEDYAGTYQITGVDDPDNPEKFYLDMTFVTEQSVLFVPFDREIFYLYAETSYNNFEKIAEVSIYPDATGEYLIRLEGFLQSVFEVNKPANNGIELTLLRKYYVVPAGFDMEDAPTVLNAVFSAIPDLTNYLGLLIPLGPAPINFINEQTQKGFPVLFSYIDTVTGRVVNITSSNENDIVSTSPSVYIPALPLDTYTVTWINPLGAIASLNVTPALPSWIVMTQPFVDTVHLAIDTGAGVGTPDYDGNDYSGDDYLTGGPNAIVGCYTYEFKDGATVLFTLEICVYPLQKSNLLCPDNIANIAWVNREGGWSSYVFDGRKTYGKEIGDITTYKRGTEIKRSTVENVYDVVEVSIANKSKKDLIFISSLRQSIQAYLYDPATLQWSIPIFVDKDSFPVYSLPFKQIEVEDKFTFRISNEIVIQTQ